MVIIADDSERTTYLSYFENKPVRFYKTKATGEIGINTDDMAAIMGYNSFEELMATDGALDALGAFMREHPGKPFISPV